MKRKNRRYKAPPVAELAARADETLRCGHMTPQARASYHRIMRLRDEIGPVDFDVAQALREIREDE